MDLPRRLEAARLPRLGRMSAGGGQGHSSRHRRFARGAARCGVHATDASEAGI